MPSDCVFRFTRPDPIYYSGETITGSVDLNITRDKNCQEVYILFIGQAKVLWSERIIRHKHEEHSRRIIEYFSSTESYVNIKQLVYLEDYLEAGSYTFEFSVQLPHECRTSCLEMYGHIKYQLYLVIERPFEYDNVFQHPVTVIRPFNLNKHPEFALPVKGEEVSHFCCWIFTSGAVVNTMGISHGGYAPGQQLRYRIEIINQARRFDMKGVTLRMTKVVKFTAKQPSHKTRYVEEDLEVHIHNKLFLRRTRRAIEGVIIIPSIPPTLHDGVIKIRYEIRMMVLTGDCHHDVNITIPIRIGTVPLIESLPPELREQLEEFCESQQNDMDVINNLQFFLPPTYEEPKYSTTRFVDVDVDELHRKDLFKPKYPMYSDLRLLLPSKSGRPGGFSIFSNGHSTQKLPSTDMPTDMSVRRTAPFPITQTLRQTIPLPDPRVDSVYRLRRTVVDGNRPNDDDEPRQDQNEYQEKQAEPEERNSESQKTNS